MSSTALAPLTSPTVIHRLDYQPPAYWVRRVELEFELEARLTRVRSRLWMVANEHYAELQPLCLDGEAITLQSCKLNGDVVITTLHADGGALRLEVTPNSSHDLRREFVLELESTCVPADNTELAGLYESDGLLITQCEAQAFRRITWFPDRPDVMARYRVTLRAERARYPVLLANGNLVSSRALPDGRHECVWDDPFAKPSYLFALVAGVLACRERRVRDGQGREHLLQIYAPPAQLHQTSFAMDALARSVAWDEWRFGRRLDLERFMIVVAPHFNMGAMENKGLNIFAAQYVYAGESFSTDQDFAAVEAVIAHEYLHNWSGNRVTCRDWFQLSLKEGLTVYRDQEFSADQALLSGHNHWGRALRRIEQVVALRATQFAEDAGPMAHPVRPQRYSAIDNFYTSTVYEKGAEVVRMLATLTGQAGFRRGLDLYFERHDGQAVTCDDFAQAIADANPAVLALRLDSFKRWYDQAGTPVVSVQQHFDAERGRLTLHFTQQAAANVHDEGWLPWLIPIRAAFFSMDGEKLRPRCEDEEVLHPDGTLGEFTLLLGQAEQRFVFEGFELGGSAPLASLLRHFSAPVKLRQSMEESAQLALLRFDDDPFRRWEAGQTLLAQALLAAYMSPHEATDAPLPTALLQAWRELALDETMHAHYRALLLSLPDEVTLAEQLPPEVPLNPRRLQQLLRQAQRQAATQLGDVWQQLLHTTHEQAVRADLSRAQSAPARSLHLLALSYLVRLPNSNHATHSSGAGVRAEGEANGSRWTALCVRTIEQSSQLTLAYGALRALLNSEVATAAQHTAALALFESRFGGHELALDKWFRAQACAPDLDGAQLARVRRLMQHPRFDAHRPSRLRSVVFAYCHGNPAALHQTDGAGYAFLLEQVSRLDAHNPMLAARLTRALERWKRLAEPQRHLAHAALQALQSRADLSTDTREVVERALAG